MKNLICISICFFMFFSSASAQDEPIGNNYSTFEKGSSKISLGLGFPNKTHEAVDIGTTILGGLLSADIDKDGGTSTPFFLGTYEFGITENISLGAYAGYFKSENPILQVANLISNTTIGSTEYTVFSLGGKLGIHREFVKNLDTYASTYAGYNIVNDDVKINSNSGLTQLLINQLVSNVNYPTFTYEVNAGAKYFLTENFGVYAEAGIGRFLVNTGATFNLN